MSSPVVIEMVADVEEFLDAEGLEQVHGLLDDLASLAETEPPAPSDELALLLAGRVRGVDQVAAGRSRRREARQARRDRAATPHHRRRAVAGLAAAAVASLTLTGVAAVANELPPGMQRAVAHFSERYLPFQVPRPAGDPPAPQQVGDGSQGTGSTGPGSDTAGGQRGHGASEDAANHPARRSAPGRHTSGTASSGDASRHGTGLANGLGNGLGNVLGGMHGSAARAKAEHQQSGNGRTAAHGSSPFRRRPNGWRPPGLRPPDRAVELRPRNEMGKR